MLTVIRERIAARATAHRLQFIVFLKPSSSRVTGASILHKSVYDGAGQKAANVTVNGPVKYAVEKRKLYVMDEDSKEHEMEIVKKTR